MLNCHKILLLILFAGCAAVCGLPAVSAATFVSEVGASPSPTPSQWPDTIAKMLPPPIGNATLYNTFINIFAKATTLSYTATHGGYYQPKDANATIPGGWEKVAERNPQVGMRALAFVKDQMTLIVYRGTDMTDCVGGWADRCADAMLWDGKTYEELSKNSSKVKHCDDFSENTLKYFVHARRFAWKVAKMYPQNQIVYTGHSLGAGLATIVAATAQQCTTNNDCAPPNSLGAFVFSSPAFINTLLNHTATDITALPLEQFAILADQWDPVYYFATYAGAHGGLAGNICLFKNGTRSESCTKCEDLDHHRSALDGSKACMECMMERHMLLHYLEMIWDGLLPECNAQPKMECRRENNSENNGLVAKMDVCKPVGNCSNALLL